MRRVQSHILTGERVKDGKEYLVPLVSLQNGRLCLAHQRRTYSDRALRFRPAVNLSTPQSGVSYGDFY